MQPGFGSFQSAPGDPNGQLVDSEVLKGRLETPLEWRDSKSYLSLSDFDSVKSTWGSGGCEEAGVLLARILTEP